MIPVVFGILAGASIVGGRMINARLSASIGPYRSGFYNYVTGLSLSLLLLLLSGEAFPALALPQTLRQYTMFTGGLIGVAVVILSNVITPRMSAFLLTLILFISQLVCGMLLDTLMDIPVSPGKFVGGILVLAGVLYNQSLDRAKKGETKRRA